MVTYVGSLFDDEKEKLEKILAKINDKLGEASGTGSIWEYWAEQKTIFQRKILDLELKEIENSVN